MRENITLNQVGFIFLIIFTSISLFIFVFWLGFPGYFQEGDIYNSLAGVENNWHPIFIAKLVKRLYLIFGKHSFYLFALNIFAYYAGFAFFITALYLRFNTKLVFFIFSLSFIGNIFFQNFIQYHSFALPMLLWLGLSMVFFQILIPIKTNATRTLFIIATSIVMMFALLWRHNAIISIFPFFIFFVYKYLKTRNTSFFMIKYISLLCGCAFILILMVTILPHLLSSKISNLTSNHIFLHQIAGAVVPSNDATLIPEEWYVKGKNFQDVKELYVKYPLHADPFGVDWEPWLSNKPFKLEELKGLKSIWIAAIWKYPINYWEHISRYFKIMCLQDPAWIFDSDQIQTGPVHPWHKSIANNFKENERKITFSPLRKKIYIFLFNHKLILNHIVGVSFGLGILFVTGMLWVFNFHYRTDILLFSLSTSLSACVSSIVFCIFTPAPDPRYMSPILVLSLVSLLSFLTFLCTIPSKLKSMSSTKGEAQFQDF